MGFYYRKHLSRLGIITLQVSSITDQFSICAICYFFCWIELGKSKEKLARVGFTPVTYLRVTRPVFYQLRYLFPSWWQFLYYHFFVRGKWKGGWGEEWLPPHYFSHHVTKDPISFNTTQKVAGQLQEKIWLFICKDIHFWNAETLTSFDIIYLMVTP